MGTGRSPGKGGSRLKSRRFRRGLEVRIEGRPVGDPVASPPVYSVTLYGADYRGLRGEALVQEGALVSAGAALFADPKNPEIKVTSPVSGRVSDISIGARRRLSSISVEVGAAEPVGFEAARMSTRELLWESGLWARMVARPFGSVPAPAGKPDAVFVSALDTAPGAADQNSVIRRNIEAFARGANALSDLTDGPVYVCCGPDAPDFSAVGRVSKVVVTGLHPVGTFGTQIDLVAPLRRGQEVWQIHAQDVIALGQLMETGVVEGDRTVALCGPGLKHPQLVNVPMGAHLADVLADNIADGRWTALSGPPIGGVESAALRRDHFQVSVLPRPEPSPGRSRRRWPFSVRAARVEAIIPTRAVDLAIGPDIPAVPLLRALSVGDVETADRLGARCLLEEDMALVSYAAGGNQDFGALLRRVLDQIEEAA